MIAIMISFASLVVALASFVFTWMRTKKEQPLLGHEVFSCRHKVVEDGKSTNLELVFRLDNRGDRGTQLKTIEVYATDFDGVEHHSSKDLSRFNRLGEHDTTKKIRAFFNFSPHFQYKSKMPCRFEVYHSTDKYSFDHESEEAESYLHAVHVG